MIARAVQMIRNNSQVIIVSGLPENEELAGKVFSCRLSTRRSSSVDDLPPPPDGSNIGRDQRKQVKILNRRKPSKRVTFDSPLFVEIHYKSTDQLQITKLDRMIHMCKKIAIFNLQLSFPPPLANFIEFKHLLDKNKISVERVLAVGNTIRGIVKVCNLAYEKVVAARVTFDNWKDFRDVPCYYRRPESWSKYDNFEFGTMSHPLI